MRAADLARLLGRLLLIFALAAVPVGLADRWLEAHVNAPDEVRFKYMLDPAMGVRDVVLGSSLARHGIDPRLLTPGDFHNFGFDGAGPGYLERLYAIMRAHQGPPARMVLAAPWFCIRKGALWRRLEDDAQYLPAREVLALALTWGTAHDKLLFNRFAFLKYRPYLLSGVPEGMAAPPSWETRGYMPYQGRRGTPWLMEPAYRSPVDPEQVGALERLLATLKADGTRVVVVQPPLFKPISGVHPEDDAIIARAAAAQGFPVLNYHVDPRLSLGEDRAAFWDWVHLGEAGSRRLSALLADDLRRLGFL